VASAWSYYRELSSLLLPQAREILLDIWHVGPMSHPKRIQKIERSAEKRAIEIARYVLPVAAFTTMVHTVSGIVLHRLWRMCAASDIPSEARAIIGGMVALIQEIDPQFFDRFGTEPLNELPEWRVAGSVLADSALKNVAGFKGPSDKDEQDVVGEAALQNFPRATQGDQFAKEFDSQLNGRSRSLARLRLARKPKFRMRTKPFGRICSKKRRKKSSEDRVSNFCSLW
jgi:hypothetical protein